MPSPSLPFSSHHPTLPHSHPQTVLKLQWKLVTISELFNDIALPRKLWEICLLLLHATHTDNPQLALKLLRSIIYR